MPEVQIIQSHRTPLPADWYQPCIASVRSWAATNGYDYVFAGDAMFELLPAAIRAKTAQQPVVAADFGRLLLLQQALDQGFERVVWIDADTLIVAPERLRLPVDDFAFGREIWIQPDEKAAQKNRRMSPSALPALRVYNKIHNAFMLFGSNNPLLEFYLYAAQRLLLAHEGAMSPQFIGPKFLASLHNLLQFPVLEEAGVICPLVAKALLAVSAGTEVSTRELEPLRLFQQHSSVAPAAVNLCGSMVRSGQLTDEEMALLVERLLNNPQLLAS